LRKSPNALRLRSQLLTHLGECERGLGNHKGALSYFERALQTAQQAGDPFGTAIATVNQARELVHLRPAAAGPILDTVEAQLPLVPLPQRLTLVALLEVTRAEHAASEQRTLDAEAAFVRALDAVERSTLVSPIEHALIARSAARFQTEVFGGGRNVEYLQRALRLPDATSATGWRCARQARPAFAGSGPSSRCSSPTCAASPPRRRASRRASWSTRSTRSSRAWRPAWRPWAGWWTSSWATR
jgi:tetratricopeptide (TPR) repeat protein